MIRVEPGCRRHRASASIASVSPPQHRTSPRVSSSAVCLLWPQPRRVPLLSVAPSWVPAWTPSGRQLRTVTREFALLGVLLAIYQVSRLFGGRDVAAAFDNAQAVLHLERLLGLPGERELQALLLSVEPLVRAANGYYAAAHLPVTAMSLLWLLLARPQAYRRARRALVGGTALALAVYLLVPVAPPRMLPGFVDTAAVHGQSVYGEAGATSLANQYAALPSLHVGWAVLVALACTFAGRTRWRWVWWAHPAVTVLVVVVTANHYWLDAAAGALLALAAWQLAGPRGRAVGAGSAGPVGAGVAGAQQQRRHQPQRSGDHEDDPHGVDGHAADVERHRKGEDRAERDQEDAGSDAHDRPSLSLRSSPTATLTGIPCPARVAVVPRSRDAPATGSAASRRLGSTRIPR